MCKILLVDDDEECLDLHYEILSSKYEVTKTKSPKEGVNLCNKNKYDLIITELNMEEMSGIVFSDLIQSLFLLPKVVILSGTKKVKDKIKILESNVLDYIDKAIEPEVLLKKVERLISKNEKTKILYSKKAALSVDVKNRIVYKNGKFIHLSGKEYNLLVYLLNNKNRILERHEIYDNVWKKHLHTCNLRVVDIHILKLRKKLNLNTLHSERGVGYKWEE